MKKTEAGYDPEDTYALLDNSEGDGEDGGQHLPHRSRSHRRCNWSSVFHWIAHTVTIIMVAGLYFYQERSSQSRCAVRTNLYSPVTETLGDNTRVQTFQGSFWQKTPYKGPPTDSVISAWEHLTRTPALNLTATEMSQMGFSLDSVQFPAEHGGGYLAYFESAHQLHCLQALWEDHHFHKYPEYFPIYAQKLAELPDIMEHHFEHCVDVLRQQLMCTADPGMVTFRWVEGISGPYPEFKTKHVCRDYEALLGWGEGRKADPKFMEEYGWPVPGDAIKLAKAP